MKNKDVQLLKEQWKRKIKNLKESTGLEIDLDALGKEDNLLTKDLKVKKKENGFLYTVVNISLKNKNVELFDHDANKKILVSSDELEDSYEIA